MLDLYHSTPGDCNVPAQDGVACRREPRFDAPKDDDAVLRCGDIVFAKCIKGLDKHEFLCVEVMKVTPPAVTPAVLCCKTLKNHSRAISF